MINKKFCLVGIDNDFEDFIEDYKNYYLGYFSSKKTKSYRNKKKLGSENIKDWKKIKKKFNPNVFITIDDGHEREVLYKKIYKDNCSNLIFDNTFISKSSNNFLYKKKGIIIQKFVKIMPNVKIYNGVKINVNCQIHHDSVVGKYSTLAPASVILGNVKIGNYTYIGANSTIKQNIKIGNNCIIGAGSVVTKDVKNSEVVIGSPARFLRKNKN
jgi:sugar O-acyltransferase (sialic acid O-acetyltransferase NeuD family)|tara:strand:- start:1629 stop:2267 length:639 start_codon:yes stop_codon:yes gene_type:complete